MINVNYREVSLNKDFNQIKYKFFKNFKKKLSNKYYSWRYNFGNKNYCFLALKNNEVIGHVGFVRYKTYDKNFFASRHSSFVDKKYRRKNIYSSLLKYSLQKLKKRKILFVQTWPNDSNIHTNKKFQNLIKLPTNKIYVSNNNDKNTKIKLIKFTKIIQLKKYLIYKKNNLINKNADYFFWRYIKKKPKENYYFHIFEEKKSLLIFNYNKKDKIYNLLDHLGKKDVFYDHIRLINNRMKFIFWININEEKTKKFKKLRLKKYSTKLFNSYLMPINKINHIPKYRSLNFSMGDTDTFIQKI